MRQNLPVDSPQPENDIKTPLNKYDSNIQYRTIASDGSEAEPDSKCRKLCNFVSSMTIEPVVFCFMFGFIMNVTILTSFMMDLACITHLNYSSEVCANLTAYKQAKDKVESIATDFSMYSNLLNLIGAFFMVFIAPWSDKYGRKPPLLMVVTGCVLSDVSYILCILYEARLEYLLLAKIPSELAGGFICVLTITYSHASEVSSENNRTVKYTTVEIAMGLGMTLGRLSGGILKRFYGYFYVYVTVGCLHAFCLVWVVLVVQETTGLDEVVKWSEKVKHFFVCRSFKNGFHATFRPREGKNRTLILLLILSMCTLVLTYEAMGNLNFVYVHHIYDWDITTYNIVQTVFSLFQMAITFLIIPLLVKIFKMNDFKIGMIGTTSMMAKNFLTAFSKSHVFIYYLGQSAGIVGQFSVLAIRSGLSKIVEKEELGKVFSFLATCEGILPMLGSILITKVFEATRDTYPNCTYSMTVLFLFIPMTTFMWAYGYSKRTYIPRILHEEDTREKS